MSWLEIYAAFGAPALLVTLTIVITSYHRRRWLRARTTGHPPRLI